MSSRLATAAILLLVAIVAYMLLFVLRTRNDRERRSLQTPQLDSHSSGFPDAVRPHELNASHDQGRRILLCANDTYAKLDSLACRLEVETIVQYPDSVFRNTLDADILFASPNKIRVEWKSRMRGGSWGVLCSDGSNVSYSLVGNSHQRKVGDLPSCLTELGPATKGVTQWLPGILTRSRFNAETLIEPTGELLPAYAEIAKWTRQQDISGVLCDVVICDRELVTVVFYVDCDNHLIRRLDECCSSTQLQKQRHAGGGGTSGLIRQSETRSFFNDITLTNQISPDAFGSR